jgi:hypothetical protein
MSQAVSTIDLDAFRSALARADEPALDILIEEAAGMAGPEQSETLARMLFACARQRGAPMACVERLLELGADPTFIVEDDQRGLAGMRFCMRVSHMTPLGQAIDDGRDALALLLLAACNADLVSDDSLVHIPDVAVLYTAKDPNAAYPVNAFAFAIACGQSEMFRAALTKADRDRDSVRDAMGRALDDVLESGLMDQGPDSILGDVVTLIGNGAPLSDFARTTLASMTVALDNGWDTEPSTTQHSLSFAAMAALSTTRLANASAADAMAALRRLSEECGVDLLAPASADYPGATLLHYAAVVGHPSIVNFLIEHGANPAAPDGAGRSATYYAQVARNQQAQALFMAECYLNLADDPSTNFGIGELPVERKNDVVLPASVPQPDWLAGPENDSTAVAAVTSSKKERVVDQPAAAVAPAKAKPTAKDAFNRLKDRQAAAMGKSPDEMPVIHAKSKKTGFVRKTKTEK